MPSKPFKILYLSSFGTLERGGQNSLLELVSRLDRKWFEPIVMVPEEGDLTERLEDKGIEVIVQKFPPIIKPNPFIVILAILRFAKTISQKKISLIHSDNVRNTFYAGIVGRIKKVPLIWHIRVNEGNFLIDRLLSIMVGMIITVSLEGKKRFSWVKENEIILIYNAVDLYKFHPDIKPAEIAQNVKLEKTDILIGEIGAITPKKAQKDLIEAYNIVHKEHKNIKLLLVGTKDKEYYEYLVNLVDRLGLSDRIYFLDYRNDMPQIISALDIVVLPSLLEGLPRIILEAMSAAKPVIASHIGGNRELVVDGETGYLFPAQDSIALAQKLSYLVENKEKRLMMGKNGRERALEYYDIEKQVVQIKELYQKLIRRNKYM